MLHSTPLNASTDHFLVTAHFFINGTREDKHYGIFSDSKLATVICKKINLHWEDFFGFSKEESVTFKFASILKLPTY